MSFRVIPFEEIDIVKWNSCVHYAPNGNVFGYHWFLKNTIREWDAIVYKDYESVMAIPKDEKYPGPINKIWTPLYLRELGLYSTGILNSSKVENALSLFPMEAKEIRIALNLGNPLKNFKFIPISYKKNHTISLYDDYEVISKRYDESFKELSEKGQGHWHLDNQIKPEELVQFIFLKNQLDWDRHTALRIIYNALHRGIGSISALRDDSGKIQAAGFFIYSHGRLVHLFSSAYQKSRSEDLFLLFDALVRTHANRPMIFDLNMDDHELAHALGAEDYSYPVLERKNIKNNWWTSVLDYFQ